MGSSASIDAFKEKIPELNPALGKFLGCFQSLSLKGGDYRGARICAWKSVDNNGNGMCSLAECDKWIQSILQAAYAEDDEYLLIWKRYRPSYIRAFNDANDIDGAKGLKGSTTTTDSYVTAKEFRLFCAYLCIYATMYEAFTMLDGYEDETEQVEVGNKDDDRRISSAEFSANWEKISGKFGFQAVLNQGEEIGDGKVFKAINGGGEVEEGNDKILIVEWCKWLEAAEVEAGTKIGVALGIGD